MPISNLGNGLRTGVCTSTNRPTTPYEGQVIYETDTDLSYVYNGSSWQQITGGTAVGNSGLVYVSSTTIGSAVASTTVASCFSATYDNYKIVGAGISTTANGGVLYLKINNSTGSTYFGNMIYNVPATSAIGGVSAANGASNGFFVATTSSSGTISFEATIDSPFLAVTSNCFGNYAGRAYNGQASGHDSNAVSSTGFILAPSSGTMTGGTIRVYGYRQ